MSSRTGLVCNNIDALLQRAEVVTLGMPHPSMPDYGEYMPNAIVPRDARPLTEADMPWVNERMLAKGTTRDIGLMAIIASPFSVVEQEAIQAFVASAVPSYAGLPTEKLSPIITLDAGLPRPIGVIALASPDRVNKLGMIVPDYAAHSVAGMRTSTVRQVVGKREGLHFDSWFYGETPDERLGAPSRLGLNLGPGDRYVIIGEYDAGDVFEGMQIPKGEPIRTSYASDYVKKRIESGYAPRGLKIRIGPGEGYIVPTELRLHDGATGELPSDMAFWIGRYALTDYELVV